MYQSLNISLYTDAQLLNLIAEGHNKAITAVYQTYFPIFKKWIINKGSTDEDANDIFQEAFMVLYQKAKDPEFCLTSKIGTYLFAVGKRIWYKKIDQHVRKPVYSTDFNDDEQVLNEYHQEDLDIQEFLNIEQDYQTLQHAMVELGEPCSRLIKLFYIEKKNMQEIAQTLQYTNAENAKVQKYKCLTRLKKIFFKYKNENYD